MATLRFTEGGREYPVPLSMLTGMAMVCPEGPVGEELGRAMLALGIPSVTEEVLNGSFLTADDRDAIWAAGDIDLRRDLVEEGDFLTRLTDAQARDIVEQDDMDRLKAVGQSAGLLDDAADGDGRISRAAADRLLEHIRSHKNVSVRAALAGSTNTPPRFSAPLAEYLRNGYELQCYPFAGLSAEDVALFRGRSRKTLEAVAQRLNVIEDCEARKAAVTLLATHPDPGVRLALAKWAAPGLAFELLADGADPEIAAVAAKVLEKD